MGKIKKILENELVGGTQSTDVYPVTSTKAVYDENNENLDSILKRRGIINVSTNYNADHTVETLTLEQAIGKVPLKDRVLGFTMTFLSSDGWKNYQFIGTTIDNWTDINNWTSFVNDAQLKSNQDSIIEKLNTKVNTSAIVQQTGDSTTSVMSQKAVTDNFTKEANRINTELGKKADKAYMDVELNKKANAEYVTNSITELENKTKILSKNVSTISFYGNIVFTAQTDGSLDINITNSNSNYFTILGGSLHSLPKTDGAINVPNDQALYLNEQTRTYSIGNIAVNHYNEVLIAFVVYGKVAMGLLHDAFIFKSKQDKLVSSTNIKTINGQSILGSGNVEISTSVDAFNTLLYNTSTIASYTWLKFEAGESHSLNISTTTAYINMFRINGGGIRRMPPITEPINVPQDKCLYLDLTDNTYSIGNIGVSTNKVLMAFNHNSKVELGLLRNAFLYFEFKKKQDTLVSGTNIKTINGQTLLGNGDIEINSGNVNPYKGKKVLILGDSITANPNCYSQKLLSLIQPSVGYRRGVYGSAIADNSTATPSFCQRVDLETDNSDTISAGMPSNVDLVIMFGGVNDWGTLRNQDIGNLEEGINRNTFYGGLHYVLSVLKSKYQTAKIVVVNLHHVYQKDSNYKEITYNSDYDITKGFTYAKNNTEKTFADYRQAIKSVSELYGCQVIDLFNVGFSYLVEADSELYSEDGLHPNSAGGNKIANYIYSQLTY